MARIKVFNAIISIHNAVIKVIIAMIAVKSARTTKIISKNCHDIEEIKKYCISNFGHEIKRNNGGKYLTSTCK